MTPGIPAVEITDHRDGLRVWRPYGEAGALHAVHRRRVGAQREGQFKQPAFVEQMKVGLAQQQVEGVGVLGFLRRAGPLDAETVRFAPFHTTHEQSLGLHGRQGAKTPAIGTGNDLDTLRARQECTRVTPDVGLERSEDGEGVTQRAVGKLPALLQGDGRDNDHVVHATASTPRRWRTRCARPCSGTSIQVGRLAAS